MKDFLHMLEKKRMSYYQFFKYYSNVLRDTPLPAITKDGHIIDSSVCRGCRHSKSCSKICRFFKICGTCGKEKLAVEFVYDSLGRSDGLGTCRKCRALVNKHFHTGQYKCGPRKRR